MTLDRAADVLEQNEWIQGRFARDIDGDVVDSGSRKAVKFCVLGAIFHVSGHGRYASKSVHARFHALADQLESHLKHPVISWNDDPARTKEEVVAALRGAAAAFREAHQL